MSDRNLKDSLPPLPLEEWKETKNTLHLYSQIIGKIRMALCPPLNHWWHVPLYVSPSGLTTRTIPLSNGSFEVALDFIHHKLIVINNSGEQRSIDLYDGLSVSEFYNKTFESLAEFGIYPEIRAIPYKLFTDVPFASDTIHAAYDKKYAGRFHQALLNINAIFEEFRGWFNGKSTPVHFFWHSFDLALTRFSGRRAPEWEGAGPVDKETYSHEVISFGFWPGDDNIQAPAFYSYTFPEPKELSHQSLKPGAAYWGSNGGSSLALLMYDEVRKSESPREAILEFLESAYLAGAKTAGWDVESFDNKRK